MSTKNFVNKSIVISLNEFDKFSVKYGTTIDNLLKIYLTRMNREYLSHKEAHTDIALLNPR